MDKVLPKRWEASSGIDRLSLLGGRGVRVRATSRETYGDALQVVVPRGKGELPQWLTVFLLQWKSLSKVVLTSRVGQSEGLRLAPVSKHRG